MVLASYFSVTFGLCGLFWINALLAILGIFVIAFITPTPVESKFQRDVQMDFSVLRSIISNSELLKINVGVLILHLVLAATFVVFPLILRDQLNVPISEHWKTYSSVFILSVVSMVPLIIAAEKYRKMKSMMFIGILLLLISMLGMHVYHYYLSIAFMLWIFFTGFNFLESVLPSLIAKLSPAGHKGSAMGVFSTFQFMGAFLGGVLGGWIYGDFGIIQVYSFAAVLFIIWLVIILSMKKPKALSSYSFSLVDKKIDDINQCRSQLLKLKGVNDVSIFLKDQIVYLKIDKTVFDQQSINQLFT